MTPTTFIRLWLAAADGLGDAAAMRAAVSALGMPAGAWTVFWPAYRAGAAVTRRRGNRCPRNSVAALLADQTRAAEEALATAIAGAPELQSVVGRTYTRRYWQAVYGGVARQAVARRQARYLVAVAGPGWVLDPAWRTSTVLQIASGVAATGDVAAVPILADALQDAGCDSDEWLALMRDSAQPWFPGARVLDTLR